MLFDKDIREKDPKGKGLGKQNNWASKNTIQSQFRHSSGKTKTQM